MLAVQCITSVLLSMGKNYLELLLLVFHLGTHGLFGGSKQWPWTCWGRQVYGHFNQGLKSGHEPAKVGRLRARGPWGLKTGRQPAKVGRLRSQGWKLAINLPRSAGWGHPSHHGLGQWLKSGHEPAKVGRLRTKGSLWLKTGHQPAKVSRLRTWPSTCQGWQVESTIKSVVQPAKVGRSMATFSTCHIWLVCPSEWIY